VTPIPHVHDLDPLLADPSEGLARGPSPARIAHLRDPRRRYSALRDIGP
jgi:hypothetical protein